MNILHCILRIYPDWQGAVEDNNFDMIRPHETETRVPSMEELRAVWPVVEEELAVEKRRIAYIKEANPLHDIWVCMRDADHPDTEAARIAWCDKITEIQNRT
jgi:hypothetical protein